VTLEHGMLAVSTEQIHWKK